MEIEDDLLYCVYVYPGHQAHLEDTGILIDVSLKVLHDLCCCRTLFQTYTKATVTSQPSKTQSIKACRLVIRYEIKPTISSCHRIFSIHRSSNCVNNQELISFGDTTVCYQKELVKQLLIYEIDLVSILS